jgi:hypothetical protein
LPQKQSAEDTRVCALDVFEASAEVEAWVQAWGPNSRSLLHNPGQRWTMAYPAKLLKLVNEFVHLTNRLAEAGNGGKVSAGILFAAGRCNAFNFLPQGDAEDDRERVENFYVSEHRKAFVANLEGAFGPSVRTPD